MTDIHSAVQPPIIRTLTAKFAIKRGINGIQGIVLHDTAGSGKHGDTLYLANPGDGRKVGVDYTIERSGLIYGLTPSNSIWKTPHAGRHTRFKGFEDGRVNDVTIGIELCQAEKLDLNPTWPREQVESCAKLCAYLVEKYNLDTHDIVTHRQIITDGSRSDPRAFPFEGLGGFWHNYWKAIGKEDQWLASLHPEIPKIGKPKDTIDLRPEELGILKFDPSGSVNDKAEVKMAQLAINKKLKWGPDQKMLVEDGLFGPSMLRAVRQFQVQFHLTPIDGKIGPKTWTKLLLG